MKITPLVVSSALIGSLSSVILWSHEAASRTDPNPRIETPPIMLVMNQDQFEGNWKQFKGDLKKKWGKFTDDDLLQIEGNYDKFEGKVQERYGDRKDDLKKWTDEWFEKRDKKRSK